MKLRLLDLFCGAGGATQGYQRAGFHVTGVDIKPQPNYCGDEFHQADALTFALDGFDVIHASPPCQAFTAYNRARPGNELNHPDLIDATRALLESSRSPWIIENVEGAPLDDPVMICGSMFDPPLDVRRHRFFETNWPLPSPTWPCRHKLWSARFDRGSRHIRPNDRQTVAVGEWRIPLELQQRAMGIDWMTVPELSQAIPPDYTEFIGTQLLRALRHRQAPVASPYETTDTADSVAKINPNVA